MSIDPKAVAAQSLIGDEFIGAALACLEAGYAPIPIGRQDKRGRFKAPWISGYHGYERKTATPDEIRAWPVLVAERIASGSPGILSLGLVLPADVVGIDVDAYDGKAGLETLKSWEQLYGSLPHTYVVTARSDGSGIRLYQKPPDWEAQEQAGSGVEFIDQNHRYIAAPPSWHHTGKQYRLLTPQKKCRKSGVLPAPADLLALPESYLDALKRSTKAVRGKTASKPEIEAFATAHRANKAPSYLQPILADYRTALADSPDNTHSPTYDALCRISRESRAGAFSFKPAVRQVRGLATEHYKSRQQSFDLADFVRMCGDAVAAANAENLADLKARVFRDYGTDDDDSIFDESAGTADNLLPPTEFEIEAQARKYTINREANRLVQQRDAEKLLAQSDHQAIDGLAFLETVEVHEAVWGTDKSVPWPTAQGFMVFGTDGAGKSTLAQQVMLARIGLRSTDVLGFEVARDDRPILYLALDRPSQIRQSIARMVDLTDNSVREILKRQLVIWSGPLPFHCDEHPELFADWCKKVGGDDCGMVIGDSVKDMVSSATDDTAGMGFNNTVQQIISRGMEFGCCHHNRKENAQNTRPRLLADVYGSRWLTAGLGSVLNIWKTDDTHRELTQLKPPYGNPFRPVDYEDDYLRGVSNQSASWMEALVASLYDTGHDGMTDSELVWSVFNIAPKDAAYEANRQKVTRTLNKWAHEGRSAYERVSANREGKPCKVWRLKSERAAIEDRKTHALDLVRDIDSQIANLDE